MNFQFNLKKEFKLSKSKEKFVYFVKSNELQLNTDLNKLTLNFNDKIIQNRSSILMIKISIYYKK